MTISKIMMLDSEGNLTELSTYSLSPLESLIAHYMQTVQNNFNTADYPSALSNISKRPSGKGYTYNYAGNVFMSTAVESFSEPIYAVQEYSVVYDLGKVDISVDVSHYDKTLIRTDEILEEAEGYLSAEGIVIPVNTDYQIECASKRLNLDII